MLAPLLLLSSLLAGDAPDVDYTFAIAERDPIVVSATLRCAGAKSGTTVLRPQGGGPMEDPAAEIRDLSVADATGAEIEVTKSGDGSWMISHAPGAALTVEWTLLQEEDREPSGPGLEYRVIATDDVFHVFGGVALLAPDHLLDDSLGRAANIRFAWDGLDVAGFEAACSFGVGPGPFVQARPLGEFLHSVFVAGRLRLLDRPVPGGKLWIALSGEVGRFEDAEYADFLAGIMKAEREFWDDPAPAFYLVTTMPLVGLKNSSSLGGTALTQSFATFFTPNFSLKPGSGDRLRLAHVLAHESQHQWTGLRVRLAEPEGAAYWFTEGFTDFATRRVLVKCGIYDVDTYLRETNQGLATLFSSPVRNAPNARILKDFFSDPQVGDLAYRRGEAIALVLDHELRKRSGGERGLDTLLREMERERRGGAQPPTARAFFERVASLTSPEFAESLEACAIDGDDPQFQADFGAPLFVMERAGDGAPRLARADDDADEEEIRARM